MSWFTDIGIPQGAVLDRTSTLPAGTLASIGQSPWRPFASTAGSPILGFSGGAPVFSGPTTGMGINEAALANQGVPINSAPLAGYQPAVNQGVQTATAVGQQAAGPNFGNLSDPSAWMNLVGNQQELRSWVQAQAPQLFANNPQLLDYYVQKVQGQPGANPTEQAGSANYWRNKILQDPGITGQSGGGAAGGAAFGGMDPSYGFRFQQGLDALQKSAASRGTLLTGGTLKGITDFGQQAASQEYQNAFGRNLSVAQLGANEGNALGSFGSSYSGQASNALTGNANAQGAADIAKGNIWGNFLSGIGGQFSRFPTQTSSSGGYPGMYNEQGGG